MSQGNMSQSNRSEIYDLGYRRYDGPRLGRSYAVRSLWWLSVRHTFGLGRGILSKVLAFGLAAMAVVPALGQLVATALAGVNFSFIELSDYFELIQVVIVLFVATMASELVGNDRRHQTLVLYFSRPIRRDDYVLAKVLALATALLSLTMVPQLVVFTGNWLGADEAGAWFVDNARDLGGIVASGALVSLHLAALGVLVASFATRRAFATIGVLTSLLFSFTAASILVALLEPSGAAVAMLLSPLHVMQAVVLVVFDAVPAVSAQSEIGEASDQIAYADLSGWVWILALLVQTALATWLAMRRYRKIG